MHRGENDSTVVRVMGTSSARRPTETHIVIKNQMFQLSQHASAVGKLQIADSRPVCCKAERRYQDRRSFSPPLPKTKSRVSYWPPSSSVVASTTASASPSLAPLAPAGHPDWPPPTMRFFARTTAAAAPVVRPLPPLLEAP